MRLFLFEKFQEWGATINQSNILVTLVLLSLIIIGSVLSNFITRRIIVTVLKMIILKTKNEYDDILLKKKVFDNLSHFIPAFVIYFSIPYAIPNMPEIYHIIQSLTYIYMVISVLVVFNSLLNALNDIYDLIAEKRRISVGIKQYIQVMKIVFVIIGIILIFSVLLDKKPGAIFAGLGAMTAIIMLIFKDSILGFVASIQLSAYKMLKIGDWISMPGRGADGDVIEISLSTVKVQNFNKTISTIPTYALVNESFTNWDGMEASGGRRVKRSISIDINTIKFLTPEMIERLKKIHYLTDYITKTQAKIDTWNKKKGIDNTLTINGKSLTNIGVFREYIDTYLRSNFRILKKYEKQKFIINECQVEKFVIDDREDFITENGNAVEHHLSEIEGVTIITDTDKFLLKYGDYYKLENNRIYKVRKIKKIIISKGTEVEREDFEKIEVQPGLFCDDMTILVRQLSPTERGLPVQIYVFAATTDWVRYEEIQGDLFDHIFAIMHEFDLNLFQVPAGEDVKSLIARK